MFKKSFGLPLSIVVSVWVCLGMILGSAVVSIPSALASSASIVSAKITSTTQFTVVYDVAVDATAGDYTNLVIDSNGGTVDSLSGSGTTTHVITFTPGVSLTDSSTGTVDIAALVDGGSGNTFVGSAGQALTDGQRPHVTNISFSPTTVLNTDTTLTVTIDFSEPMETSCTYGFPYPNFEWSGADPTGIFSCPDSINWNTSSQAEVTIPLNDVDLEQTNILAGVYTNGLRDAALNYLVAYDSFSSSFSLDTIDQAEPQLVWSKFTGPNTLSIKFTEVDLGALSIGDFSNLVITGEGSPRSFTDMDTTNSPEIVLTFDGAAIVDSDTGTVDIQNTLSIQDVNGNEFTTIVGQAVGSQLGVSDVYVDDDWDGPDNDGGNTWAIDAFADIATAMDAVNEGGTVHVGPGTYINIFTITKPLTLLGDPGDSSAGPGENAPVLHYDDCDPTLSVDAPGVTVSGIILEGECDYQNLRIGSVSGVTVTDIESRFNYAGVGFSNGATNNVVTNSLFHDLSYGVRFRDGSYTNVLSDNEIYDNDYGVYFVNQGSENGDGNTIDGNYIHDNLSANIYIQSGYQNTTSPILISDNTITGSDCEGVYIDSDVSGVVITGNTITNNGNACFSGITSYSVDTIGIHNNYFSGNSAGVDSQYEGMETLDATMNYWGAADGPSGSGPGSGDTVNGGVLYDPWFTDETLTTLSSYEDIPITSLAPLTFNIPIDQTTASTNIDALLTIVGPDKTGVIPQMSGTAQTAIGQVTFAVPAGTTVTGPNSWDGTLKMPQIKANNTVTNSGGTVTTVVEIGFDDVALTFDKGVRLLIAGQGGKSVGYTRSGVFTAITSTCAADNQATGDALAAGADCKITVGPDMVVWTKHFTSFVTYTATSGGGGGGGSYFVQPSGTISINAGAASTSSKAVTISITQRDATEIILSEDPNFLGATYQPIASSKSFTLSSGEGTKTVYALFRNSFGISSAVTDTITYTISAAGEDEEEDRSTTTTDTSEDDEESSTDPKTGLTVRFRNPLNRQALRAARNLLEDSVCEEKYRALLSLDALEFKTTLTSEQLESVVTFVCYGIDDSTDKLGAGERRAQIRDYLETAGFADISWGDIVRNAVGQKLVKRNLANEQKQVPVALERFRKIFGHDPNFKDADEDLAWNTLMYRIRFDRNLDKERLGITRFRRIFGYTPTSPLDWSAVRILGYIVK